MNLKPNMLKPITMACALTYALATHALPEDKNTVANLVADTAQFDQNKHNAEFIGHVRLVQGSTTLEAHKIVTQSDKLNKLMLAVATGSLKQPAEYSTLTQNNKPRLFATAKTIEYYPKKHQIKLVGNAKVTQGHDIMTAQTLVYDTLQQRVVSQNPRNTKVSITIHADVKHNDPVNRQRLK